MTPRGRGRIRVGSGKGEGKTKGGRGEFFMRYGEEGGKRNEEKGNSKAQRIERKR